MIRNFTFAIGLFLSFSFSVLHAQQDPMFTKYFFNTLSYNPGYAGTKDHLSVNALVREQWVGWGSGLDNSGGAPSSQTFTIHSPIIKRVGVGLSLSNDRIGATKSSGITGNYAYQIPFGEAKLSLGISAGVSYWRADFSDLTYRSPQSVDPVFSANQQTNWIPAVGAGLYFYHKYYYVGFSSPRLFSYQLRNIEEGQERILKIAQAYPHYFLTTGAAFRLRGDDLIFKPMALVKSVNFLSRQYSSIGGSGVDPIGSPVEFEIDASLLFYNKMWVGIAFRSTFEKVFEGKSSHDSADVWASFYLKNGMRVGMAYDYPLTEIGNYTAGSFELMVGYDFDYLVKKVVTPRYF